MVDRFETKEFARVTLVMVLQSWGFMNLGFIVVHPPATHTMAVSPIALLANAKPASFAFVSVPPSLVAVRATVVDLVRVRWRQLFVKPL